MHGITNENTIFERFSFQTSNQNAEKFTIIMLSISDKMVYTIVSSDKKTANLVVGCSICCISKVLLLEAIRWIQPNFNRTTIPSRIDDRHSRWYTSCVGDNGIIPLQSLRYR